MAAPDNLTRVVFGLFKDTDASAIYATMNDLSATWPECVSWTFETVAGDTSTHDYKVRVGPTAGLVRMNGKSTARLFGGVAVTSLIIEELKV
jgi:hypothetical protein